MCLCIGCHVVCILIVIWYECMSVCVCILVVALYEWVWCKLVSLCMLYTGCHVGMSVCVCVCIYWLSYWYDSMMQTGFILHA